MAPHLKADTVRYKVFISGKSGVGKTALAARLAGHHIPSMHYETTGKCLECSQNPTRLSWIPALHVYISATEKSPVSGL